MNSPWCRTLSVSAMAAVPLAIGLALASPQASAAGFQLNENSPQGMGRAYAGMAAAPGDCAVVANNPAAMTDLGSGCVSAAATVIDFHAKFHGGGTDLLGDPLTGGNGGDAGVTKAVPALFFAKPITSEWTLGAGISVPFGLQTEYPDGWVGRYNALLSKLESIALTFSAAYKVSDELSLGGSVIAQRTSATLSQAINFGTILAGPTGGQLLPQEADGFGQLKGDDWGYGFDLGLLWKPTPADRIGLNFHSQVDQTLSGKGTFLVPSNIVPLLAPAFTDTDGSADFDTPAFASLDWWHTVDDQLSFGAHLGYTHWSSFKTLVVHYANPAQPDSTTAFDYKDAWFFSVGGDYKLDPNWTLRAGVAYDETPTTTAHRDPRVPDNNRTWLSLGVSYGTGGPWQFDLGYAHLFVNDASINTMSPTFDTLVGSTKGSADLLGVTAQYRF